MKTILINVILFLICNSAFGYEFTSNERLLSDLNALLANPSGPDNGLIQYIENNSSQLPRFQEGAANEVVIPTSLSYFELTSRLMEVYEADVASVGIPKSAVFQVAALWAFANCQNEMKSFIKSLDQNDPSYRVRMNGFKKIGNGIYTFHVSVVLSVGESRYSDLAKLYMLDALAKTTPRFVWVLGTVRYGSLSEIMRRFDISDQSDEVKRNYLSLLDVVKKQANKANSADAKSRASD